MIDLTPVDLFFLFSFEFRSAVRTEHIFGPKSFPALVPVFLFCHVNHSYLAACSVELSNKMFRQTRDCDDWRESGIHATSLSCEQEIFRGFQLRECVRYIRHRNMKMGLHVLCLPGTYVQSWAKKWSLGCLNSRHVARGSQLAGFTQPRAHLIAQLCTLISNKLSRVPRVPLWTRKINARRRKFEVREGYQLSRL